MDRRYWDNATISDRHPTKHNQEIFKITFTEIQHEQAVKNNFNKTGTVVPNQDIFIKIRSIPYFGVFYMMKLRPLDESTKIKKSASSKKASDGDIRVF